MMIIMIMNGRKQWQWLWLKITGRSYNNDNFCVWHEMRLIIMTTATSMRNALISHVDDLWAIYVLQDDLWAIYVLQQKWERR